MLAELCLEEALVFRQSAKRCEPLLFPKRLTAAPCSSPLNRAILDRSAAIRSTHVSAETLPNLIGVGCHFWKVGPGIQAVSRKPRKQVEVKVGNGLLRRRPACVHEIHSRATDASAVAHR